MRRSRNLPVFCHYRTLFESGSFCGLSDGELLARFLTRDGESAELAFAVLVERHASGVLRICKAIAGNASDAEDAFQATFLVLATKAAGLTVRETLRPWLASVARRISRHARAAARARAAREERSARREDVPEALIEDGEEDATVLREEIDRLPERYRLPILLCDLECQSHHDAARALGWPLGTVKSRQARGRQRLRARLARRGFSGAIPAGLGVRSIRSFVADSLIQVTARAAVRSVSRGEAAEAVSAAVSSLVSNTLRAMIMSRICILVGVLLTLGVGVAATVVGQTFSDPTQRSGDSLTTATWVDSRAASAGPVFEYEIRIWKDGAPVTPTMKLRAHPGETSQLKIPDGTIDLSFQPGRDPAERGRGSANPTAAAAETRLTTSSAALKALLAGAEDLNASQNGRQILEEVARLKFALATDQKTSAIHGRVAEALLGIARSEGGTENKDHEKRLAEIERKLERILSVLDRVPQKDPGANSSVRP